MDELKHNVPELSKINKEVPFRAPDAYFTDFSARLQTRLGSEPDAFPQKRNRFIRYLKPAFGMAASFTLIFMLVYWPLKSFLPDYLAETNTYIEHEEDIDTYMPSIERIDENSFFVLMSDQETEFDEKQEEMNDEDLLSYLSANVSDYEIFLHAEN